MKKLRLLVTKKCNRNCEGCCNKEYNLDALPVCTSFEGYDEIILTGGEPYLFGINQIIRLIKKIRKQNKYCKIYIHSADYRISDCLDFIDGLTFTIHKQKDVYDFTFLNNALFEEDKEKSLRLYLMPRVELSEDINLNFWQIKHKTYDKDCPLPKDEVFMRLEEI